MPTTVVHLHKSYRVYLYIWSDPECGWERGILLLLTVLLHLLLYTIIVVQIVGCSCQRPETSAARGPDIGARFLELFRHSFDLPTPGEALGPPVLLLRNLTLHRLLLLLRPLDLLPLSDPRGNDLGRRHPVPGWRPGPGGPGGGPHRRRQGREPRPQPRPGGRGRSLRSLFFVHRILVAEDDLHAAPGAGEVLRLRRWAGPNPAPAPSAGGRKRLVGPRGGELGPPRLLDQV